ncbi:aspartyl protease family protein At5g10770-like [Miscanthus floridulus]|uniref:aspartyl protease family protein At5g10770-like n=1 Tax=Miscanthus floridulus TaxID=154761 RepID=UPI0034588BDB
MESAMFPGCCLAAVLVAALASPHRLATSAAAAGEGSATTTNWHDVSVKSLLPNTVCTATKGPAAPSSSALTVVHRHGPCSPLQSRGGAPSHTEILRRDQDRVDAIRRKGAAVTAASKSKGGMSLLANWGKSLGTNNYVTSLRLGTPATDLLVELDTGSTQSWVQCKPCAGCYEQHDPVFDPTRSATYSAIPCGARECQELSSSSRNCSSDNKKCPYEVSYGDDSYTVGDLARDTLTLSLTPADTVLGFVFGCGHSNAGTFGEIDGLLGLGRGKASLPSQVAARYGAGFSYCLPSSSSAAGYLSFGGAAAPANAQFTEMVTGQDPTSYYLNLTGIMVAGRAIKVPPSVFATAAGTIIDSGTAFSRLPPRAYAALRSSFRSAMGRYRYKRAPSSTIFDTCYDFTGHETVQIPSVALVFADGATVHLHPSGVLYTWNDVSQTCLAFVPNQEGILGNTQQRTLAVIYDVGNQKIGFGAKGCA